MIARRAEFDTCPLTSTPVCRETSRTPGPTDCGFGCLSCWGLWLAARETGLPGLLGDKALEALYGRRDPVWLSSHALRDRKRPLLG